MEDRGWNTKLLISLSLVPLFLGIVFLWFGFKPEGSGQAAPSSTPLVENELISTDSATQGLEGERVKVTKVVDGDTIVVLLGEDNQQTVRLIGIDTPETVDPRRPVGCFGKEASNKAKELLSAKQIILQKDVSETDKYKRLLRYIFLPLPDGRILFVNDYMVREGFAKVLTYPPDVKFNEQFRQAEQEAREGGRGLWGKCR